MMTKDHGQWYFQRRHMVCSNILPYIQTLTILIKMNKSVFVSNLQNERLYCAKVGGSDSHLLGMPGSAMRAPDTFRHDEKRKIKDFKTF